MFQKRGHNKGCSLCFLSKAQKRGQQSSFGMSFGMIFSIILIIVFIATAVIVLNVFLGIWGQIDYGTFHTDLQAEVNSAWRSSETSKPFSFDLGKDITYVCFANLSKPATANFDIYDDISDYEYYDVNTFLLPPGIAGELEIKYTEHIDIEAITASENPYCVENPGQLRIYKGLRSRLVSIE